MRLLFVQTFAHFYLIQPQSPHKPPHHYPHRLSVGHLFSIIFACPLNTLTTSLQDLFSALSPLVMPPLRTFLSLSLSYYFYTRVDAVVSDISTLLVHLEKPTHKEGSTSNISSTGEKEQGAKRRPDNTLR